MFKYAILGSGSSGNSYIFEKNNQSFLIDAGYSCKELLRRIGLVGFDSNKLCGVCITHTHSDHFRGAEVLCRKLNIPLYLHSGHNPYSLFKKLPDTICTFAMNETFSVGPFVLTAYPTYHDSPFSCYFTFIAGNSKITVLTDTGKTDMQMELHATESEILFLEANYDEQMLYEGPYPYPLKKRIDSANGHLSNTASVSFVNTITGNESRINTIYFCHMSGTNNNPGVLESYIAKSLQWTGTYTVCEKGHMYNTKTL